MNFLANPTDTTCTKGVMTEDLTKQDLPKSEQKDALVRARKTTADDSVFNDVLFKLVMNLLLIPYLCRAKWICFDAGAGIRSY